MSDWCSTFFIWVLYRIKSFPPLHETVLSNFVTHFILFRLHFTFLAVFYLVGFCNNQNPFSTCIATYNTNERIASKHKKAKIYNNNKEKAHLVETAVYRKLIMAFSPRTFVYLWIPSTFLLIMLVYHSGKISVINHDIHHNATNAK